MVDLRTSYMGVELENPFIAGACEMTAHMEALKKIEEAGAGGVVIKSLFEEQVQLEALRLEDELTEYDERHAEMIGIHPTLEHGGPKEHLHWVKKAVAAIGIPVFASLNCVNRETWVDYSKELEKTGIRGLELNFYSTPLDMHQGGQDIEQEQVEIFKEVKREVSIPVSLKLSPFYANPLNVMKRFDDAGADGLVLFNRFFQPDIDPDTEQHLLDFNLSNPGDYRLPLRFTGLLSGKIRGDICASGGIFTGVDAARLIMAGASCVQVVSALYRNSLDHIHIMKRGLEKWMESRSFSSLDDFRGRMSKINSRDPFAYERAQYVSMLMKPEKIIRDHPQF